MRLRIFPSRVEGSVLVPSSKSVCHRAVICGCLAKGESVLRRVSMSKDILATVEGMRAFGAQIAVNGDTLKIQKSVSFVGTAQENLCVNCGESGSTLRFLIPLAAILGRNTTFLGEGRLMERPQEVYETLFREQGLAFSLAGGKISLSGRLHPAHFILRGDISSQFITGLLLTLPLLNGESVITVLPPFESRSYIELTLQTMRNFGVHAEFTDSMTLKITGGQQYRACETEMEGDFSQAAFFAVLGVAGGRIECRGLHRNTAQGDSAILEILRRFGGKTEATTDGWGFSKSAMTGCEIDLADCPDLGPILTVLGACSSGTTKIKNAGRLRLKESDRIAAMESELRKLGIGIRSDADSITIEGGSTSSTQAEVVVSAHNDHRIAMSLGVYASLPSLPHAEKPASIVIEGAECVEKSYPMFWEDLRSLGVRVEYA